MPVIGSVTELVTAPCGIIDVVVADKRSTEVGEAVGGETVGGVCDGFKDFDAGDVEEDDEYGRAPNVFRSILAVPTAVGRLDDK